MELVHCMVCGEPFYTTDFKYTLTGKMDRNYEPLCPRHRSAFSLMAWQRVAQDRDSEKRIEK
jgi:hypothetical protein